MKIISEEDTRTLAYLIERNIREEFSSKKLSGNLVKTMKVEEGEDGEMRIIIPAEAYDMYMYLTKGIIIHNGRGSYAQKLNDEGSYIFGKSIGNHKGFVQKAIDRALTEWEGTISGKAKIVRRTEK